MIETLEARRFLSATGHQITLKEHVGQSFTATLGTLKDNSTNSSLILSAAINWGDGDSTDSASAQLNDGVVTVTGTHTYSTAGKFNISVTVTAGPPHNSGVATPMFLILIGKLRDKAVVSRVSLNGTITGKYYYAPVPVDIGAHYIFSGSGTASGVNHLAASGNVVLPGFITSGSASGTLTLSKPGSAHDSITLALTGPTEVGYGPFPSTLNYTVSSGTGEFAGLTGSGTIAVTLSNSAARLFEFIFNSAHS